MSWPTVWGQALQILRAWREEETCLRMTRQDMSERVSELKPNRARSQAVAEGLSNVEATKGVRVFVCQIAYIEIDAEAPDLHPRRGVDLHVSARAGVRRFQQIGIEGTDVNRIRSHRGIVTPECRTRIADRDLH